MKFNRDFINAMDGTGRLLLAFDNVSLKKCKCLNDTVYNELVSMQIICTFVPAETWEQCLFTVRWPV